MPKIINETERKKKEEVRRRRAERRAIVQKIQKILSELNLEHKELARQCDIPRNTLHYNFKYDGRLSAWLLMRMERILLSLIHI